MNMCYIVGVVVSTLLLSPLPRIPMKTPDMVVAEFKILLSGDRETVYLETSIDRTVYHNDCDAFYDLCQFRKQICDSTELVHLEAILKILSTATKEDTTNLLKQKF